MKGGYALPEGAAAKILARSPTHGGVWQADVFTAPIPLREGNSVIRPPTTLIVDAESGFIFQSGVSTGDPTEALGDALLEAMGSHDHIPSILKVKPTLAPKLAVFSHIFSVRIEPETKMPELARARRSMGQAFKKWQSGRTQAQYPAATFSVYGPDDRKATKLVVGIVNTPEQAGPEELMIWEGPGVVSDPQVRGEVEAHLISHRAKVVIAPGKVMGCPHQEGKDFPIGGDCPSCPFWRGKQGSGAPQRDIDVEVLELPAFFARWKGSRSGRGE